MRREILIGCLFVTVLLCSVGVLIGQEFNLNSITIQKDFEETERVACLRSFRDVYKDKRLLIGKKNVDLKAVTTLNDGSRKRVSITGSANLHRELSSGNMSLRNIELKVLSDTLYEAKLSDYEQNFSVITGLSSMVDILGGKELEKHYSCQRAGNNQWVFLTNYKIKDWLIGRLRGKPTAISIDDIKSRKIYVKVASDGRLELFEYNVPAGYYGRDLTHKSLKYVFHPKRKSIELGLVDYVGTNDAKQGLTHMTVSF